MTSMFRNTIIIVAIALGIAWFAHPAAANTVYTIPSPVGERLKDFSVVEDQGTWHAFAMSVCLNQSNCNHTNSVIWHYVSRDLVHWDNLGVVLAPRFGTNAADRDDVWAPSVVAANGQWYMFYTAVQYGPRGPIQRIAVATSMDLLTWNRTTNNVAFECSSMPWAYWNENDIQGLGTDCRDSHVMWDDTQQRWLMSLSARTTDQWGAHPMIIGQVWSDDFSQWQSIGTVPSTKGGVAESSHVVQLNGQYYLLWTNGCANGQPCLHWASASTPQGPFGVAQGLAGADSWGYASETLPLGEATLLFYVGGGILEHTIVVTNNQLQVTTTNFGQATIQTAMTVPGVALTDAPAIPQLSYLLYRDTGDQLWNQSSDQFIGSFITGNDGRLTIDLPPGEYWLVPDFNEFLAGQRLAYSRPTKYVTAITTSWGSQQDINWTASVSGRRWIFGSSNTNVSLTTVPMTAVATSATAFDQLNWLAMVGANLDSVRILLSNDNGVTWYTVDGGAWVTTSPDEEHAVTIAAANQVIASFPVGIGQLRWQVFAAPEATMIAFDIGLDQGPSVPAQLQPGVGVNVATMRPIFQIQSSDPNNSRIDYVLQYCGTTCRTIDAYQTQAQWTNLINGVGASQSPVSWYADIPLENGVITWRVQAVDVDGAGTWSGWSDWHSFQTPNALTLTQMVGTVQTTTSAIVTWQTNHPSTSYLYYSDEEDHELSMNSLQTQFSTTLTNLYPGSVYTFFVTVTDIYGQSAQQSVVVSMPISSTIASAIHGWVTNDVCHVGWTTSDLSIGTVRFGWTSTLGQAISETTASTTHDIILPSCPAGQTVYFQVSGQGQTYYQSALQSFSVPSMLLELPLSFEPIAILRTNRNPRGR